MNHFENKLQKPCEYYSLLFILLLYTFKIFNELTYGNIGMRMSSKLNDIAYSVH